MAEMVVDNGGDLKARREEVLAHLPRLERYARVLLRGHADAADLVQDTMERALRALPSLRPSSNLTAWLNTLLNHRFIDWTRRADRRVLPLAEHEPLAPPDEPGEAPAPWLDIEAHQVRAAIDRLPAGSATILRMRVVSRMSYRQISRRLGISCDTVGTRLLRARRRLRQVLIAEVLDRPQASIERIPPSAGPAAAPCAREAAQAA